MLPILLQVIYHIIDKVRDDSLKSKELCLFSVFITYNLQLAANISSIVKKRRSYIVLIPYIYTESVADLSSQQEKAGIEVMTLKN